MSLAALGRRTRMTPDEFRDAVHRAIAPIAPRLADLIAKCRAHLAEIRRRLRIAQRVIAGHPTAYRVHLNGPIHITAPNTVISDCTIAPSTIGPDNTAGGDLIGIIQTERGWRYPR